MELRITNTLSYYNVNESFGQYNVGDKIDSETYLNLSDNEKSKCYSALINIEFDPNEILFDITNELYKEASNVETTVINGMTYVKAITFLIDASSSKDIRFYKVDVSKDYTYPDGSGTSSIVKITSK